MSRADDEVLNLGLPKEKEQDHFKEQEEEVQADTREGIRKIIDRERGPGHKWTA